MSNLFNIIINILYYLGLAIIYGFLCLIINPINYCIQKKIFEYYIYTSFFVLIIFFIHFLIKTI
jgi:hypothetical protein